MTAEELVEIIATNVYEVDWSDASDIYDHLAWLTNLINKYGPAILPDFEFPKEVNND